NQAFLFRQNTAGTVRNAIAYRYAVGLDFDQPSGAAGGGPTFSTQGLCTQIGLAPANPAIGTGLSFRYSLISQGPTLPIPPGASGTLSLAGDADGNDPGFQISPALLQDCQTTPYTIAAGFNGSNLEAMYIADTTNHITVFSNDDVNGDYLM